MRVPDAEGDGAVYAALALVSDGPTPLENSLLSFSTALFDLDKRLLGTFVRNLAPLPGAKRDPEAMERLAARGEGAVAAATLDPVAPAAAMGAWLDWLEEESAGRRVVFAAWPLPCAMSWLTAYCARFSGRVPPGSGDGICLRSHSSRLRRLPPDLAERAVSEGIPKRWHAGSPETGSFCLSDAVSAGNVLVNLLREERGLRPIGPFVSKSGEKAALRPIRLASASEGGESCRRARPADEAALIHSRTIEMDGLRRKDGMWIVRGRLRDVKHHGIHGKCRGWLPPGSCAHDISAEIEVDDALVVRKVTVSYAQAPYPVCAEIAPSFSGLVGLSLSDGFSREARKSFAGTSGCIHVAELLPLLATTAFQTILPWTKEASGTFLDAPPMPDACHALALDGPFVREHWPEHAKPQKETKE